jgi:hypothetical protein
MNRNGEIAPRPPVRLITAASWARQWQLLGAAPALVALGASLLIGLLLGSRTGINWVGRYDEDATHALISGDYPTARVCFERLVQHSPDDLNYCEGLSLALRRMSRTQQYAAPPPWTHEKS